MRPIFLFGLALSLASTGSAAPNTLDEFLAETPQKLTPDAALMKAAASGDTAKIAEALQAGADVNFRSGRENMEFREGSLIFIGDWGGPPLAIAAGKGRLEAVGILLEKGAKVDGRDSRNFTALIYAARKGNAEIIKLLLDNGADVNARSDDGRTALDNATRYRNLDAFELLVERGANINYRAEDSYFSPALIEAIGANQTKMVARLLEKGADVNIRGSKGGTALMAAVSRGNAELVKTLLARGADVNAFNDDGSTALNSFRFDVKPDARQEITRLLNDAGATKNGWTPVMAAANEGDLEKVRAALEAGADINQKGARGDSPLRLAVRHPKVVSFLIERGADMDSADDRGTTSLIGALNQSQVETARILLEGGADPNAPSAFGESALSRAIDYPRIVALLLAKGAKVKMRDSSGKTALDYALQINNAETIELLKNAGDRIGVELNSTNN